MQRAENRLKDDWKGFTLPGRHIEKNESPISAAVLQWILLRRSELSLQILNLRM